MGKIYCRSLLGQNLLPTSLSVSQHIVYPACPVCHSYICHIQVILRSCCLLFKGNQVALVQENTASVLQACYLHNCNCCHYQKCCIISIIPYHISLIYPHESNLKLLFQIIFCYLQLSVALKNVLIFFYQFFYYINCNIYIHSTFQTFIFPILVVKIFFSGIILLNLIIIVSPFLLLKER